MADMHRRVDEVGVVLAVVTVSLSMMGCSKMSINQEDRFITQTASHEWPVRYKSHRFDAYCYDTIGCRVEYNNMYVVDDEPEEVAPSSSSEGANYRDFWDGSIGVDHNFPTPAVVTWRSKDGVSHKAKIDIGEIFKDQIIRTPVPREEIAEDVHISDPAIILEVNDRTINVYMKTDVPLKKPKIPGNDLTYGHEELILAYSKTF